MRKEIRLLLEGFFDDDIFNPNDINQDILNIGDQYYNYKIGDIYYEYHEPYAICCGNSDSFTNKKPRFVLINNEKMSQWSQIMVDVDYYIDNEDGYYNTTKIKQKGIFYEKYKGKIKSHSLSSFPAFYYCINLDNNVYLPAIKELDLLYEYRNEINEILAKVNGINLNLRNAYWSSTQINKTSSYSLFMRSGNNIISLKSGFYFVRPFILID